MVLVASGPPSDRRSVGSPSLSILSVLSTTMTICLLPENKIMDSCTYLLSTTDVLDEAHVKFSHDIRKLCVDLKEVFSLCSTSFERYDSVLSVTIKRLGPH